MRFFALHSTLSATYRSIAFYVVRNAAGSGVAALRLHMGARGGSFEHARENVRHLREFPHENLLKFA